MIILNPRMEKSIKNAAAAGFAFSSCMVGTLVAYAAISSVWTNTAWFETSSWTTLSSATWNQLVWNVQQLKDSSASPGSIASIKAVQTRTQATYTAPWTGNWTAITPLDIVMTPKKSGNMVILEWVVHGEIDHNTVFLASRNWTLLPNATDGSNNRWAGVTTADYDGNNDSTPNEKLVRIIDFNSLDTASTYQLLVRSADANSYTFYFNRTVASTWVADYESGLSTGIATEVYQ